MSFHVRQFLRECEQRGVRPSEDSVTSHLRVAHAEYQRKPQVRLRLRALANEYEIQLRGSCPGRAQEGRGQGAAQGPAARSEGRGRGRG